MSAPAAAVVIPAYEPDERLILLVRALSDRGVCRILIVDDGSGSDFAALFAEAGALGCQILTHARNLGKGRALKDGFAWCLAKWPALTGVVTADADGQHRPEDIVRCMEAICAAPDALILGVRDFQRADVPARSRFGNRVTRQIFRLLAGLRISDTQTGLRGIGAPFMRKLLDVPGERYEFETNMLLETKRLTVPIREIPIETVYIEENRGSHFRPLVDSARIYALFFRCLFRARRR